MIVSILKTSHVRKKFQLQSCPEFYFVQLYNRKFCQNIASLAVARGVVTQLVTIATKMLWAIDQIIVSSYI